MVFLLLKAFTHIVRMQFSACEECLIVFMCMMINVVIVFFNFVVFFNFRRFYLFLTFFKVVFSSTGSDSSACVYVCVYISLNIIKYLFCSLKQTGFPLEGNQFVGCLCAAAHRSLHNSFPSNAFPDRR